MITTSLVLSSGKNFEQISLLMPFSWQIFKIEADLSGCLGTITNLKFSWFSFNLIKVSAIISSSPI